MSALIWNAAFTRQKRPTTALPPEGGVPHRNVAGTFRVFRPLDFK